MEENVVYQPIPPNIPVPPQPQKKNKLLTTILLLVVILLIGGGLVYTGMILGKKNITPDSLLNNKTSKVITETIAPKPSEVIDETVNWNIYNNKSYNFSIKFPKNWKTWSQGSVADTWQEISSPDMAPKGSQEPKIGIGISIRIFDVSHQTTQKDLANVFNENGVIKHYKVSTVSQKEDVVQGSPAIIFEGIGTESPYLWSFWNVAIAKSNYVILITVTDFKEDPSLDSKEIVPKILSTFKFIDQTLIDKTVNWKTYRNTEFEFSFRYKPSENVSTNEYNSIYGGKAVATRVDNFDWFIEENKNGVSLDEFIKGNTNDTPAPAIFPNKVIGELTGTLAEFQGYQGQLDADPAHFEYYFGRNGNLHRLRLYSPVSNMSISAEDRETFMNILKSVSFN